MDTPTPSRTRPMGPAWDMAAVSVISLWLAYWFIPAHIPSSFALGLAPEILPTACALGMAGLSAIGFVLSLIRGAPALEMAGVRWIPVVSIIGLCAIGVVIISFASLSIGALYLVPALMLLLGERRWTRIVPAAISIAALIYFIVP